MLVEPNDGTQYGQRNTFLRYGHGLKRLTGDLPEIFARDERAAAV